MEGDQGNENALSSAGGSPEVGEISAVDADDLLAGYVDVVPPAERRSSPFSSPNLRTVQEAGTEEIPRALPEASFVSPHHRGTPTTSTSRTRRQRQVTYEDLASRPRSNPRSRTPMRYESPLEHSAFRRNESEESPEENVNEARRITIRPMAGMAPGVVARAPDRARFSDTTQRPQPINLKSYKQGPSRRKTNRWNNDNLGNAASELANASSSKSRVAAEILSKARADARHFLPVYDPNDKKRSDQVQRFMKDEKYSDVRDKFFSGELHASNPPPSVSTFRKPLDYEKATPEELFLRIDGRLRRVVVKACENSAPACKIVESFEDFLVKAFTGTTTTSNGADAQTTPSDAFWKDVLTEQPSVTRNPEGCTTVTFLFDGQSSAGGFHRILVHAISHFHCLKAKTSSIQNARVLSVKGDLVGSKHRLLDYLESLQGQRQ